ncbi:MAG: TSUP family transporter [Rubricoccaceae bacterium]
MLFPFLLLAGAAAGFVAGLVGVGGGIIFGPVLFYAFQSAGITDPMLAPLTLGSGLLCTGLSASSGARAQFRARAVETGTAMWAGAGAALTVTLVTVFATTQPWYDRRAYQLALGVVLLWVVVRMLRRRSGQSETHAATGHAPPRLGAAGIGAAAGVVSAAAGVGGGVVLVPAFNGLLRLPLKVAAATSTVAIVLVSFVGVATYVARGWGLPGLPPGALGYVHLPYALALAAPAMATARLGVRTAHRVRVRTVQLAFAALASFVAAQLLLDVLRDVL